MTQYVKPARERGDAGFKVRAGDVHRKSGLSNAMPAVCSALGSGKFESLAEARLMERTGPANSSTVEFTFAFSGPDQLDIAAAEAELRSRYGELITETDKMAGFALPDGRQVALQRDVGRVQIWVEDEMQATRPPAEKITRYASAQGRHSNLPERLSHAPAGGAAPRSVALIQTPNFQTLTAVLDWYNGLSSLNREALNRYRGLFLARYPDFGTGGFEKTEGGYFSEEREYKDQLLALTRQAIEEEGESDPEKLGARLLNILLGASGAPGGLLGWRTDAHVKQLREQHPGLLELQAGRLARAIDSRAAIPEFVDAVWPVLSEGQKSKPYSESRNIPTMLAALVHPDSAYGINTDRVLRTAKALTGEQIFSSNPLTPEEYRDVLSLALNLKDIMDKEWGWAPRDLWDVQGFIWAVNRPDGTKFPGEDNMKLNREAVIKALDECDELTVQGFLDTYGFHQPSRYWISERGKTYPSKAIASVAYQYLPGGEVRELHGTVAWQTLERLGFTIVKKGSSEESVAAATNLILYGPPGTGKTYESAREAVTLCTGSAPEDRDELMDIYTALVDSGRIEFVTFHQSYSYEEFVEGLRPTQAEESGSAGFELRPEPGTFRRIARRAETSTGPGISNFSIADRQIFKMSIGEAANPDDANLFEDALSGGYTLLGFGDIDWSDARFEDRAAMIEAYQQHEPDEPTPTAMSGRVQSPFIFRNWMQEGDLVVVSKGNSLFRAIGVVTGAYRYTPREGGGYAHRRTVNWLWHDRAGVPVDEIYDRGFTMKSIYVLSRDDLNIPALERYVASQQEDGGSPEPFVLVIDEINRANISKVFGELITLIEPDKRIGAQNELKVRLSYSRERFGVPANLHIVGTMNTADRSIALLDTALRRRFKFRELMPDPSVLQDASTRTGVNLVALLQTLNQRIEYLFDREHQIGHAYFIRCETLADVHEVMRYKVIPLLAEYFYEDWSKVAVVLGDAEGEGRFIVRTTLKAPLGLRNDGFEDARFRWSVREEFADNAYDQFV